MESLVRKLQEELRTNAYTKSIRVSVEGFNGSENFILLTGSSKTFYQKQCAQEVIRKFIPDGITLRNEIDVLYSTETSGYDGDANDSIPRKSK